MVFCATQLRKLSQRNGLNAIEAGNDRRADRRSGRLGVIDSHHYDKVSFIADPFES